VPITASLTFEDPALPSLNPKESRWDRALW